MCDLYSNVKINSVRAFVSRKTNKQMIGLQGKVADFLVSDTQSTACPHSHQVDKNPDSLTSVFADKLLHLHNVAGSVEEALKGMVCSVDQSYNQLLVSLA